MPQVNNKKIFKLISYIGILALVALLSVFIVQWSRLSFISMDALEAVPYNSAFVVDVQSPDEMIKTLEGKPYFTDINQLNFVNSVSQKWQSISKVIQQIPQGKPNQITIAAQIGAKNQLDYVFILSAFQANFQLSKALEQLSINNTPLTFDKQPFYQLQVNDTTELHVAQVKKLLIVAESPVLVENVLDQLKHRKSSISKQKSLRRIRSMTGKTTNLALYFNMEYVPVFSSFFAKERPLKSINFLKHYAEWIGVDVNFEEKNVSLNGYLYPSSQNQLLKSLKKQELPDKTLIASVLPDNTAAMTYIGYKDATDFFSELQFTDNADFQEYFVPWLGEEIAYIITEPHQKDYNEHKFAIFKIKDDTLATELLDEFSQHFGQLKSEDYFNYSIHQVLAKNLLKPVFGNGMNPIHNPYYVLLEDYLIMGNSIHALKEFLDKYTYGQTLGQDINYLQFVESLSSTSNMYFYINTANALNILTALFQDSYETVLEQEFDYYQKLTPVGIQLTPYKDFYFLNAKIQYNKKGKQATSVLWKADLQTNAAIAPSFVKNHSTKELEVFIQDEANIIYLFNKNGEELWHRAIDGRIISDIHQIDFFKNTYLQYLFNTDEKIYLVDRNGENVQEFPITLNSTITNGIMVVDYDSTRDYRYFVACEDGNVFGFHEAGQLLDGWSPKTNMGIVRFPLQHFQDEGKDYIIALNEVGEMQFFQRNGEVRMDSIHFNTEFRSTFGFDLTEPKRIVVTNHRGKAHILNFRRKYFRLGMNVDDLKDIQFEYADVIGDERKDYIVLGSNELGIFSYLENGDFEGVAMRKFETPQDVLFQVPMVNNPKIRIGTYSKEARRVYLFNEKARLFPDFPLAATTTFNIDDLYNDGKNVLIVGNGNAVFAYKLKQLDF